MTKRPVPGGYTLEPLPTPNIGVCTPKCCGWGPRLCRSQGVCRELVSAGELHLQAKRESSWRERGFPRGPGLGLRAFNTGSTGLIPGQENKIPHAHGTTKKNKREREMEGESEGSWAAAG